MSNPYYTHGSFPSTGSAATSASMRAELDLISLGFDKLPTLTGNNNKFVVVNSTGTGMTATDVLPVATVNDNEFTFQDEVDNSRKFQFQASGITPGATRIYTMPNLDTTLVGTDVTQTLTNKTLTSPVIGTIVNTGTLTLPTSTDTLVGRATTDTLTNKTLTSPVIGTIVNTGTLTLPTSTDTLVGRATTDTLTNKTISGANNTLTNIANGSLSNSAITLGSNSVSLGGTMSSLAGVTISGTFNTLTNIANASLVNSGVTINGSTVALGGSMTIKATATNALTIGNGLSGTSYDGSGAVTIAINTAVTADLSTAQTFSNKTISGSANTLTNIGNGSLTNSSVTIGSSSLSLGGTLTTFAGVSISGATNTLTNIGNGSLTNSSITIGSTAISLGGTSTTLAGLTGLTLASGSVTLTGGTANGVAYLNGSKVVTTGSALTFDGTNLALGGTTNKVTGLSGSGTGFTVQASGAPTIGIWDTSNASYVLNLAQIDADSYVWNGAAGALIFGANNAEQMRLTSTGLGIGTSSPAARLSVFGISSAPVGSTLDISGYNSFGHALITTNASNTAVDFIIGTNTAVPLIFYTGAAEKMRLDSSGNLGVGVTPSAWNADYKALQIGSKFGSLWGRVASDEVGVGQNMYRNTGGTYTYGFNGLASMYQQSAGAHYWSTAPSGTAGNAISFTQAMTLDSSGNLLVNMTSASAPNPGFGVFKYAGGNYAVIGHTTSASSGDAYSTFYYNGSSIGSITQNGTTGVLYNITSDYRLKNVIGAVSGHGERIDALEPIEYEWKADGSRTRGFLAHKFQEVYAGSVHGEKDAIDADGKPIYQGMQAGSSEVIADLVAEIQSLRKRLSAAGI